MTFRSDDLIEAGSVLVNEARQLRAVLNYLQQEKTLLLVESRIARAETRRCLDEVRRCRASRSR
jgi:hypothetical protein